MSPSTLHPETARPPCGALRPLFACAAFAVLLSACEESPSEPLPTQDSSAVAGDGFDARADAPPDAQPGQVGALGSGAADPRADAASSANDASPVDAGRSLADAGSQPATDAGPRNAADAAQAERSSDFAVGTRRIEIAQDGGRVLPVQLWYPALDTAAAEADAGHPIEEFEAAGARRELLTKLLEEAPNGCPNRTMHAAIDAAPYPRSTPFPVLVYSHHFNGTRFSMFTVAEGLARAGMVVAAPDHVNGSLFERQDVLSDALGQFNEEFLQMRIDDLRRVLDVMLDPQAETLPPGLRGRMDPARVGAVGHSIGGITVGAYSVADTRVRASAYLAIVPSAALARLLIDLPTPEHFRTPALYLTAAEDAVVEAQGGKQELAANYDGQPLPAAWIDVADTGHMSFADDCGLVEEFEEGCGSGSRISNGESFSYLDGKRAREIAAHYTAAYFAAEFLGASRAPLGEAQPKELVTTQQHGAKQATP